MGNNDNVEALLQSLELERDMLRQEVTVASEMLAQILLVTGPVKVVKGTVVPPKATISVDFDTKGEYAMIELVVPDAD